MINKIMFNFDFSRALVCMKDGNKVQREGWNGKDMWLLLVKSGDYSIRKSLRDKVIIPLLPWIGMKTADEKFVPWLASQSDILADDWMIFSEGVE